MSYLQCNFKLQLIVYGCGEIARPIYNKKKPHQHKKRKTTEKNAKSEKKRKESTRYYLVVLIYIKYMCICKMWTLLFFLFIVRSDFSPFIFKLLCTFHKWFLTAIPLIQLYGIATCPWQWFIINYSWILEFANESLKYEHWVWLTRDICKISFPFHWIW